MSVYDLSAHPAADLFPRLSGAELDDLADDIREHGLLEPITLLDGLVLDGRNRLAACALAVVEPAFVPWDGEGDPVAWVVSKNLKRRHLDTSQRAMVAARLLDYYREQARARQGERTDLRAEPALFPAPNIPANLPEGGEAREHAARDLNVSPRTVEHAAQVLDTGTPALVAAVERGEVAVSSASAVASLPTQVQDELVARGPKEILAAAKLIRAQRADELREERIEKIREIATGNAPLATTTRYPVLLADPPWRYEFAESESRAIENQYPSMALDDICALPVGDVTTDDAILFLWVTSPKLAEGLRVVAAWGFTYRTCMVWVKDRIGMGYYARQKHELLLIATKGRIPAPAPGDRPPSVVTAPMAEHSEKPVEFHAIIAAMYPDLPRLEMFARRPVEGWDAWGNQAARSA